MRRFARHLWRIRHVVVVPFLLVAPALEALDGDVEDVRLGTPPTLAASQEQHGLVTDAPGQPAATALPQRRVRTPTRPPTAWRRPMPYPVHHRPVRRASAATHAAPAEPL